MEKDTAREAGSTIWAKSGATVGHGLLWHMLDVAAAAEAILTAEPAATLQWMAPQFGLSPEQAKQWLPALAGLHDYGKATPGFQAKWPEGMQADQTSGLTFPPSACRMNRHDLGSAALLAPALFGLKLAEAGWLQHVTQAVSAHHGYHFKSSEAGQGEPHGEPVAWTQARAWILDTYWQLLSPQGRPALNKLSLPAVNWLAGLTSVADWIASNPEWFALGRRGFETLAEYHEDARRLARVALDQIGWHAYRLLLSEPIDTDAALARIVEKPTLTARPLQQAGDRLLRAAQGPSLVLVEAPMGEGKTELAFLAHLRLQAINGHRGLYLALPTQATGNALFKRALTFLEQFADRAMDVQLVHGGAATNEDVRHLRGIDNDRSQSLSASAWFSRRKRPLLSPYGVGTVDQALLAVLNVKHHFVRLWGLSNRVVVLDEVHAYDTYTSGLIAALLRWLKALGCSVVLMSATLPSARRAELLRAWGRAPDDIPDLPYPRVLLADDGGVHGEHFNARPLAPIHLIGLDESLDTLADTAVALLGADDFGCGALIVNTVHRAQALYIKLRECVGGTVALFLFHARFPADERAERERQVLGAFGVDGVRPRRALLIATQVAEQSLDIDFDFMLSDLAPVDLLLQRAGRLHRHANRIRSTSHAEARLWVAGLGGAALPELKQTAWGYVYEPYILFRTWALLRREAVLHPPADIDRLVQAVYGDGPLPADLEEAIREKIEIEPYGKHQAKMQIECQLSFDATIDVNAEPGSAYANNSRGNEEGDGEGQPLRTRLGPESLTLIPVEVVDGGWRARPGETPFAPEQTLSDQQARQLHDRQLKVSRARLVKHFNARECPASFAHPLLRHCRPLPLSDGQYCNGDVRLRLDAELGLVFED